MRFGIYTKNRDTADPYPSNADTGSRLWEETQTVTVKNGIFRAFLGSVTPFPASINFETGDYYIGMRIGTDSEMVPRKQLGSVPSAINAQFLQGRTIGTTSGNIPILGNRGKLNIKNLPTGTGDKQLVLGNDSRLQDAHQQNTDTGTDAEVFNLGSGTAISGTNFDLTVSSSATPPALRYNGTTQAWQLSNNGSTFSDILSGSAGISGTGTNGYVAYWTGTDSLGSEATLATSRGGTGLDGSAAANGSLLIGNGSGYTLATLVAGSAGLTVTNGAGSVTLDVDTTTTGTTATTSSNSGLETMASGIRLLGGCSNDQVLAWSTSSVAWVCSNKTGGTSDWTSSGSVTYLTDTTDNVAFGGSTSTSSRFFFDVTTGNQILFEGTGADDTSETALVVTNPTADRTITFGDASGTVLLSSTTLLTLAGTSGSNQTLTSGDTLTIAAGTGITTTGGATDTVTIAATLGTSVDGSEITDNTIEEADLEVTNAPTGLNGYILSFDEASGGFTWIANTGGTGSSKFTDGGTFTYLTSTTDDFLLGGATTAAARFFFDVTTGNQILFEGTGADDTSETALVVTNPTADRTITFGDASGTVLLSSTTLLTLAGTSGSNQTLTSGDTLTIAAGTGITTTGGATDTVTIAATLGTSVDVTSEVTGVLPIANGGTNKALTLAAGAVIWTDADSFEVTAAGTSGQALISGGTGTPTWYAPTAGSVLFAGTSGILQQDNSNFFWDDSTNRLGLGTTSPAAMLSIFGTSNALRLSYDASNYATLSASATGTLDVTTSATGEAVLMIGDTGSAQDSSAKYRNSAQTYYAGLDGSTGSFMIGNGSTVGTNAFLTMTSAGLFTFTGSALTGSTFTTLDAAALTTGYAMDINVNGAAVLTSGGAINIDGPTGAAAQAAGSLLKISTTGAVTGTAGSGNSLQISSATVTGTIASITDAAVMTTTGNLLTLTANSATTATGLLTMTANALTSGGALTIASSSAAFTGALQTITLSGSNAANTGSLLLLADTGALNTSTPFKVTAAGAATQVAALIENTGSGTSFRVNDAASDSTPFLIDASGNVGIGDSTPASLLTVGSGDLFNVNTFGDVTSTFSVLDGSTTANGAGTASTTLILTSATNFNVGNYVLVNSTYAKITNIATNTLTISPALTWANLDAVTEYHIPEIGATDLTSTLANRYGRGYFIDGVVTGNATTYYTESGITSSVATFNLLTSDVTAVNIGGSSAAVTISGSLTVSGAGAPIFAGLPTNGVVYTSGGTGTFNTEAQLALARGGTNKNVTASAGAVFYSDTESFELTAVGNSGECLKSGGTGAPTWAACGSSITADSLDFIDLEDTLDLDAALTVNQGSNTWIQNFTGTSATGLTYSATALTTGSALNATATNTATANTALSAIQFNLTNAQATSANTNGVTGLAVNFTNSPTIAGNTEYVVKIQNQLTANTTDNAVAALLLLDNADSTASGTTVVTDAISITNSGGSNFTNFLNTPTLDISALGAITGATSITSSGTITFSGLSTAGIVTNTSGGVLGTTVSVPIANGGTNATSIGSAGSIPYSTGTAYAFSAVGTTGQALISGGTGSPTFYAPTAGSILFAGTSGILSQDNASIFFDDTNNRLGIGTAAPSTLLEVSGSAADVVSTITAADATYDPILKFRTGSSPSVQFSLGVDNSDSDKFKIYSGDGLGSGDEFVIDASGVTTIANLNLGATTFDTNAGIISWIDMPVTSSATIGTVESYSAQIDGNSLLTIYAESDGAGSIQNQAVNLLNGTVSAKLLSTNFGAAVYGGAFIDNTAYYGQEFGADTTAGVTADDATVVGDDGKWYFDTTDTTASYVQADQINGYGTVAVTTTATDTAGGIFFGDAQNNLSLVFAKANLPVVQMKLRNTDGGTTGNDVVWGLMDQATSVAVDDTLPANGIFFWNNNTTTWTGVVRSGGANVGTATCGTVSTTQFAVGRIEVISSTSVKFYMDTDASDGVSPTLCGTVTGANPTAALGLGVYVVHTGTTAANVDVDYARVWQDDAAPGSVVTMPSKKRIASVTDYGELGSLDLITDSNASKQSIDALFQVAGDALNTLSDENLATADKLAEHDTYFANNLASITALRATAEKLGLDANAQASKTALLEIQMQTLTEQVATLADFFTTFDLGNMVVKDSLGNVDLLGGTLKAAILETGALTIEVVDAEAPTIGTATLYPVATDTDNDGNDDYTDQPMTDPGVVARDGKFVQVMTKAMIPMVNGSRIFTTFKNNPNGFSWIEKVKDDNGDYVGFKIRLSDAVTEPVKVDWLLVEQKEGIVP
ncbi:MAG: hypothetical protein A2878_02610 [Candidatus Moranbacteria bacterium RIFCSPHIGHO2_01_FULL_54_31]|nr:MAG: hypothetical protein A2878_02610 [Candidatus Moranbacteria bacterium RIFCSPHIGHO2_01_FULL_54_31]